MLRDLVILAGYPVLVLLAQLDGQHQFKYYQDIDLLTKRLQQTHQQITGMHSTHQQRLLHAVDARSRRSFWLECTATCLYYTLLMLTTLRHNNRMQFRETLLFVGIMLALLEFGYAQSWSKLSASMLHHRARSTSELMRLVLLARPHGSDGRSSMPGTSKVMSLVSDVCRIKRQFEFAFGRTLLLVYEILLYTTLFNVYFTLQMSLRSNNALLMLLDFMIFQFQIVFSGWMVRGCLQQFGGMVSDNCRAP